MIPTSTKIRRRKIKVSNSVDQPKRVKNSAEGADMVQSKPKAHVRKNKTLHIRGQKNKYLL